MFRSNSVASLPAVSCYLKALREAGGWKLVEYEHFTLLKWIVGTIAGSWRNTRGNPSVTKCHLIQSTAPFFLSSPNLKRKTGISVGFQLSFKHTSRNEVALEIAFNLDWIDIISVSSPDKLFNYLSEWSAQISWEKAIWTRLHISVTQRLTACLSTRQTNHAGTRSLARTLAQHAAVPQNQMASSSDATYAVTNGRRLQALKQQR